MAFVTFGFFQAFNLLNVRSDTRSFFSRETFDNPSAFVATGAVIVLLVLVVEMDALHDFFSTTHLPSGQWLACAAIGSTILWVGELLKAVLRARARAVPSGGAAIAGSFLGLDPGEDVPADLTERLDLSLGEPVEDHPPYGLDVARRRLLHGAAA